MKVMYKLLLIIDISFYLLSSPLAAMQPDKENTSVVSAKKSTSTPLEVSEPQIGIIPPQNRSSFPVANDTASGRDSKADAPPDERSLCLPGHGASPLAHTVGALNGPRQDQDNRSVVVYNKGWNTLHPNLLRMIFAGTDVLDHLALLGVCKGWRNHTGDPVYLTGRITKITATFLSRPTHYIMDHFNLSENAETLPLRQLLGGLLLVESERLRAQKFDNARAGEDHLLKAAKNTLDAACHFGEPVAHELRVDYMTCGQWGYRQRQGYSMMLTEQLAEQGHRWAMERILDGYTKGQNGWPRSHAHAADANDRFAKQGDEHAFMDMIENLFSGGGGYHENPREAYKRLLELDTTYANVPKSNRIQEFLKEHKVPCGMRVRHKIALIWEWIADFNG